MTLYSTFTVSAVLLEQLTNMAASILVHSKTLQGTIIVEPITAVKYTFDKQQGKFREIFSPSERVFFLFIHWAQKLFFFKFGVYHETTKIYQFHRSYCAFTLTGILPAISSLPTWEFELPTCIFLPYRKLLNWDLISRSY